MGKVTNTKGTFQKKLAEMKKKIKQTNQDANACDTGKLFSLEGGDFAEERLRLLLTIKHFWLNPLNNITVSCNCMNPSIQCVRHISPTFN